MTIEEISTFGKHMICPPDIYNNNVSEIGLNEFEKYTYRHLSTNYNGNSQYTIDKLLKEISKSILRKSDRTKIPLLLLSDGKDSLSLAVAYKQLNISCYTLTLLRQNDHSLRNFIEKVSRELGHIPFFVSVDDILSFFDVSFFIDSFKKMSHPVLDQGYLFFLMGLKICFEKNKINPLDVEIIDGLGNDEYFGYLMSKNQWYSYLLSLTKIWKIFPKYGKKINWYIRSPCESHGDLSALSCFFKFPQSYNLNNYFSQIPLKINSKNYIDFRAFSRGKYHDHQCMMGKTIVSANFLGSKAIFPWVDNQLANYCFNIPQEEKYNFNKRKNKIPLRKLLINTIGWNQEKRGIDLFFDINEDFILNNFNGIVPLELINIIRKKRIHYGIKNRAYLELLNFYFYCVSQNKSYEEIKTILGI